MYIVGLTGGIGSGKSTVAQILTKFGVPVYNSDEKAKYLMNHDISLVKNIVELFGSQAYTDNKLNRAYLAEIVFSDKEKLHQLEKMVHPAVKNDFQKWVADQDADYVVMENAVLFKSGMDKLVDYVIFVTSPIEIREKRVVNRDKTTVEQVRKRISNQDNDEKLLKKSDYILINNGSISELEKKLKELHSNLKKMLKKS